MANARGEINRFQRLSGGSAQASTIAKPSLPVGFASGNFGALASHAMTADKPQTPVWRRGNSFVAAVSFGLNARTAKSILYRAANQSDVNSKHFQDHGDVHKGQFKDVLFYPEDYRQNFGAQVSSRATLIVGMICKAP